MNYLIQLFSQGNENLTNLSLTWLTILFVTIILCFITAEFTRNYSQVDKIWSIFPIVLSVVTLINFPNSDRLLLMTFLVTLWGIRLSYNFYRKGGYNILPWKGEEDYRWTILRRNPLLQGFRFTIFNLFFISFYQLTLISLFSSPLLLAAKYVNKPLSGLDFIAAIFIILFLTIETIADNQLFNFHQEKKNMTPISGKFTNSLEKGFMTDGLWKYVRHPNFISEQLIWITFYLFSVSSSGDWLNWTIVGPVLLVLLFATSSQFTENISLTKYSDYQTYKQNVPRFLPIRLI
jgi:steroid 5-alpha reductase family enzyme